MVVCSWLFVRLHARCAWLICLFCLFCADHINTMQNMAPSKPTGSKKSCCGSRPVPASRNKAARVVPAGTIAARAATFVNMAAFMAETNIICLHGDAVAVWFHRTTSWTVDPQSMMSALEQVTTTALETMGASGCGLPLRTPRCFVILIDIKFRLLTITMTLSL